MLKIEKTVLPSPEQWQIVIEGMRNPLNSWGRMDSTICPASGKFRDCKKSGICPRKDDDFAADQICFGTADLSLMERLTAAGSEHAKYRRMLPVWVTITAPRYWWTEYDTYKVGTVANSCSTMHKIAAKEFTAEDFSHEHLIDSLDGIWDIAAGDECRSAPLDILCTVINALNVYREKYLETKDNKYWWQMIQLLPQSYNQRRTLMLNYEVLATIYRQRKDHKLAEWNTFCEWIETLPYAELIVGR